MQQVGNSPDHRVLRRQPKQERSRERVDEILKVAMALIGEKGIDAVTMKEVAMRSGGPIASVYQYFPNKSSIIEMLYDRFAKDTRELINDRLQNIETVADIFEAVDSILETYYQGVCANPALQDLVNATQADKALQMLDIVETRIHAEKFTIATDRFIPENSREQYARISFLMFQLTGPTVRLALLVGGDEGDKMLADYRAMIHGQLRLFLDGEYQT